MVTATKSIKITSNIKHLPIEMDGRNVCTISFDPNDKNFVEKMHRLYFEAKEKVEALNALIKESKSNPPKSDEQGMPLDIDPMMEQIEQINRWFRDAIDTLFGNGTAQKIYGSTVYMGEGIDVYLQLLTGIAENVEPVRQAKTQKYVRKK